MESSLKDDTKQTLSQESFYEEETKDARAEAERELQPRKAQSKVVWEKNMRK